jgi:hypothetical protein
MEEELTLNLIKKQNFTLEILYTIENDVINYHREIIYLIQIPLVFPFYHFSQEKLTKVSVILCCNSKL